MSGEVATFEIIGRTVCPMGEQDGLAQASASLPPGAYTTLRVYPRRRVLRLDQHLARLRQSVALQGQVGTLDTAGVRAGLAEVLTLSRHTESRIRLTCAPPRLFASVEAFRPLAQERYQTGVECVTVRLRRESPHAKDTRFISTAGDACRSLPPGVEEGLMVAEDGSILEGLSSNFFATRSGELWTEDQRALPGVTRSLVLELAKAVIPVKLRALRLTEVATADECFITSVSREILPVVSIDQVPVGDGRPGPTSLELLRRFTLLVEREAEPLP
jgi:branched-chain amino acid aminotransferase